MALKPNFSDLKISKLRAIASIMFGVFLIPFSVQASSKIGVAQQIQNLVLGDNLEKLRQLSVNDPVYSAERISAEPDSHGEILLDDQTKIIVGPGAEVSLDDFVVSKGDIQSGTVGILKGSFRFISGSSPKGTFNVKTPLSTIGIRGTVFDVYVRPSGETDVVLFDGAVRVCSQSNQCEVIDRPCDIVRVSSRNQVRKNGFLRQRNRIVETRDYGLSFNQERFPQEWQAPIRSCDQRAATYHRNRAIDLDEGDGPDDPNGRGKGDGYGSPGITY